MASAEIVIAELTGSNPNVYLELGYAWGCGKRTILLAHESEKLPFDTQGQRCLIYDTITQLEELLRNELAGLLPRADGGRPPAGDGR